MKGPSLQRQFNALSEKYPGKKLDVELQPHDGTWNGYDATFRTIKHEHWQLVINDVTLGLWDGKPLTGIRK